MAAANGRAPGGSGTAIRAALRLRLGLQYSGPHHDVGGLFELHEGDADLGAALHRRRALLQHLRRDGAGRRVGDAGAEGTQPQRGSTEM